MYYTHIYMFFFSTTKQLQPRVVSQSSSSSTLDCHFHSLRREKSLLSTGWKKRVTSTYIICSAFSPTNLIFLLFLHFLTCLHSFFLSFGCYTLLATLKFSSSCLSFEATSIKLMSCLFIEQEKVCFYISSAIYFPDDDDEGYNDAVRHNRRMIMMIGYTVQ